MMSTGDTSMEFSYVDSEIVRNSLIPIVDEAAEEVEKLLKDAKSKSSMIDTTWRLQTKNDSFQVEAMENFDVHSLNDITSLGSLRSMAHSFADQATIAKRETASYAQKNLNLQSRLSATEIANKRLITVLTEVEAKMKALMDNLIKQESTRINFTQSLKELTDRINNERRNLGKELTSARQEIAEYQANNRQLETLRIRLESSGKSYENRAVQAETEVVSLKTQLAEALRREKTTEVALQKAENQVVVLRDELDRDRNNASSKMDRIEQESKRALAEKENALKKQVEHYKKEINQLHTDYSQQLQDHFKKAQEAIDRLTHDIDELDESRMKYYNLYKGLLDELNDHKRKISQEVVKKAAENLLGEFRQDQDKTNKIKQDLRNVKMNRVPNFGRRCLEALQSSDSDVFEQSENLQPPRSRDLPNVARSYSVTGRFQKR